MKKDGNKLHSKLISQRLYNAVLAVLEQHKEPMEIGKLEGLAVLKVEQEGKTVRPDRKNLYILAVEGESDLIITEYPSYKLKSVSHLPKFHDVSRGVKYPAAAAKALISSKDYVDLIDLIVEIEEKNLYPYPVPCPEYWMYHYLNEYKEVFSRKGYLKIGLKRWQQRKAPVAPAKKVSRPDKPESRRKADSDHNVTANMLEANLESIVIANLDIVEEGLRLIKRQFVCPGIGRIDVLCEDKRRNLVVIELKKFGVNQNSVIDQIARYVGYVKTHIAKSNQKVRGIIIVAKVDEKLRYAVAAFPNIEVKTFSLSIG